MFTKNKKKIHLDQFEKGGDNIFDIFKSCIKKFFLAKISFKVDEIDKILYLRIFPNLTLKIFKYQGI